MRKETGLHKKFILQFTYPLQIGYALINIAYEQVLNTGALIILKGF
jgi:hypothetical protein